MPKAPSDPKVKEVLSSLSARKQYWEGLKNSKPEKDGSRLVKIQTPDGRTVQLRVLKATAS